MTLRQICGRALRDPQRAMRALVNRGLYRAVRWYNALITPAKEAITGTSGLVEFDEIVSYSRHRGDISDHLLTIFAESMETKPRLIVELGVRGGASTFVFERVARLCGSALVSVDSEDCSAASRYPGWTFVKSDDVEFARQFPKFCAGRGIEPEVDVLFIDTSHFFDHTVAEIRSWFPFLAKDGIAIFHDTNLRTISSRRDGSLVVGWNNRRGVIAAIEAYLGKSLNEKRDFLDVANGWLIKHQACCFGLTVLRRVSD
jgi:hypothetical protein